MNKIYAIWDIIDLHFFKLQIVTKTHIIIYLTTVFYIQKKTILGKSRSSLLFLFSRLNIDEVMYEEERPPGAYPILCTQESCHE